MGGNDNELSWQGGGRTVTRGRSVSRGQSVSTAAAETVRVRLARTTAENGEEIRRILLEELVRLLAAAPEAVTLDGVAASGKDFLLTLRLPQAMLSEVVGLAGTSQEAYLVVTRKGGTSEA